MHVSFSMLITLLAHIILNFQPTKRNLAVNIFSVFNLITLFYMKCYIYTNLSRRLINHINQNRSLVKTASDFWSLPSIIFFPKIYQRQCKYAKNAGGSQKLYILNIMYTICIQSLYRMYMHIIVYMQNGFLISTYFDSFVVHFLVNHCKLLRLETCWLIMGGANQINGLMNYILH